MTIAEMKHERAKVWEQAKAFLDAHEGVMSAEDEATYNKMEADMDGYTRAIERAEAAAARDAVFGKVDDALVDGGVKGDIKTGRASDEYRSAFVNHIKGKRASNALQEDTSSEGGYLVPTEFERTLYASRDKVDPIFALAGRISLGSLEKNVPIVASNASAVLVAEEGSFTESDPAFTQAVFHAYKFGLITKASDELISDSAFDIENFLAEQFGRAIGNCEAGYFWTGTGSSQPQGVMAGISGGVTTAANNAITADEVMDLYFSVGEQYRGNAVFVFNDGVLKVLRKLKDGNGQYLWAPGLNGDTSTLLGKPVYTSANIASISSSAKVGVFGDIGACYKIADRQGTSLLRLNELYAANGQVGFRGYARADGRVLDAAAAKSLVMHA